MHAPKHTFLSTQDPAPDVLKSTASGHRGGLSIRQVHECKSSDGCGHVRGARGWYCFTLVLHLTHTSNRRHCLSDRDIDMSVVSRSRRCSGSVIWHSSVRSLRGLRSYGTLVVRVRRSTGCCPPGGELGSPAEAGRGTKRQRRRCGKLRIWLRINIVAN